MENEKLVKKILTVYTEIEKRLVNKAFKFSQGGATNRTLLKFLGQFEKEFGTISIQRLVDFCICTAHFYHDKPIGQTPQKFGQASIKRFATAKKGKFFYEDQWLEDAGLTRTFFYNLVTNKESHPQAKYIYVEYEEGTKKRMLNKMVGYAICQASTLGWAPKSPTCSQCDFVDRCKKETEAKYPELYRIRLEDGESNS